MREHERSKVVDGIRMRWLERGEGVPVVLIHGIPTGPGLWRHVTPLVRGARLLSWEMVGYGESIPQGEGRDISLAQQVHYLRSWMGALDIRSAILVGHDLGGGVAQIAAVRVPILCGGLVLTNAVGYDSWPIPAVKRMRALGPVLAHMPKPLLRRSVASLIRRGHDDPKRAKESLKLHFGAYARHGGGRALLRQMRSLDTHDTVAVQSQLPSLRGLPARIVWGGADEFQKLRYARRFARDLDCPLVTVPGGHHFMPEDHPEMLAEQLQSVVDEVRAHAQLPAATSYAAHLQQPS